VVKVETNNVVRKPRYLILGASGLLGSRVFENLKDGFETFGTFHNAVTVQTEYMQRLDLTNLDEVKSLVERIKPSHVVNCAGLTNVEKCELLPEASWKLNTEIPFRLAKLTSELDIRFIHISTDHFASIKNSPRGESDLLYGINQYGFTKIMAEKLILRENPKSLILRTNFFGTSDLKRESLLGFAIESIQSGKLIYGFDDVIFSPVGMGQICQFLKSSQISNAIGVLNFASDVHLSKYEFMVLVAKVMGVPKAKIVRSSIETSNLTAKRPNYLALDSQRLNQELHFALPGIEEMIHLEITRTV
jgi:dTDP-4-dehydrorhamnose reductase